MKSKIISAILATSLIVTPVAHADDDAAWAIGGFILGVLVGQDNDERRSPPPQPPPPPPEVRSIPSPYKYRQPRLIPQYKIVCDEWMEYDSWGNPRIRRQCHQELIGYREAY